MDVLKNQRRQDKVVQVQRVCYGTPALYAVESLPSKYRAEVKRRFPDPEAQAKTRAFIDTIVIDNAATAYYEGVSIEGARGLSDEKRMLYTNSDSILNACRARLMESAAEQRKVGKRRRVKMSNFWAAVAEHLPRVAEIFPHSLPEIHAYCSANTMTFSRTARPTTRF